MKLAMVSIYPPPNTKHSKLGGVASYTHNLANSLHKNSVDVTVFSNKLPDIESNYIENGITVIRCWNKGVIYPFQILYYLLSYKSEIIHIQHEFFLYGNGFSAVFFPLLELLLKLLNKPVIVTIHGVIPLSKLNREFIAENKLNGNPVILKAGLYSLVKLIIKLSSCTIVHENKFMEILHNEYKCNPSKIQVIPHGIEDREDLNNAGRAKEILGYQEKKIVLFFGYLTGYKGIELLIDAFDLLNDKDAILLIAGGEHPRLKEQESYKKYVASLRKKANDTGKHIIFTGFIPEDKIAIYFSASDVVVCPYTVFMSSSGPLSLCIAYRRPFLLSDELRSYVDSDHLIFENNPESLSNKLYQILNDHLINLRSLECCDEMKMSRSWEKVAERTHKLYLDLITR